MTREVAAIAALLSVSVLTAAALVVRDRAASRAAGAGQPRAALACAVAPPADTRAPRLEITLSPAAIAKLEAKRKRALKRKLLEARPTDWVPVRLRHGGRTVRGQLRLKGDMTDHLESGCKRSYRIKVQGRRTILGMKVFSIQHPRTRGYLYEWLFHELLRREGLVALRYGFVHVTINGIYRGIQATEEHFGRRLIANNTRRPGPILKFDETIFWREGQGRGRRSDRELYLSSRIDSFQSTRLRASPTQKKYFDEAARVLDSFRRGKLRTRDVFDVERLARFYAVALVAGAVHALRWHNMRFYYNPVTSLLEPVGFDAYDSKKHRDFSLSELDLEGYNGGRGLFAFWSFDQLCRQVFADEAFSARFVRELTRVSRRGYLDRQFSQIKEELRRKERLLLTEYSFRFTRRPLYENQRYVRRHLGSAGSAPGPGAAPGAVKLGRHGFLWDRRGLARLAARGIVAVDHEARQIDIRAGRWVIDRDVVFPAGYRVRCGAGTTLELRNRACITSLSALDFRGSAARPIRISSTRGAGQGLLVIGAGRSRLDHVIFSGLSSPDRSDYELTGGVTFYESAVTITNSQFLDARSEDALNVIRGEFTLEGCRFDGAAADALDADFASGAIRRTSFARCGGDAVDLSGGLVSMDDVVVEEAADKAVSAGEAAQVHVGEIDIAGSTIGIASKDRSVVTVLRARIQGAKIGLAAYEKKTEYGPAWLIVRRFRSTGNDLPALVEQGSAVLANGETVRSSRTKKHRVLFKRLRKGSGLR